MLSSTARFKSPLKISRAGRRFGLAALLVLVGSSGLQDAVANGDTRTLSLFHLHTRDSITVTFKRNGQYDEAGLAKLNHFLRDWRNGHQIKMEPRLFDIVWQVNQDVGGSRPIEIISAYRSPATNSMLRRRSRGVAKASQHTLGRAMDFHIPGVSLERVRNAGLRLQRGGVGFYPTSGSPFVHLDVGSVRHWPRLSPDALARVFPDGRTVHVPSNGRPMSGYALALADIAKRGASPSAVTVAAANSAGVSAAAEGPAQASAASPGAWFSRLFNGGQQTAEQPAAPVRERAREAAQVAVAAAAVPMPRHRPAPQAAPTVVASAAAPTTPALTTPAQVIASRGYWGGPEMKKVEAPVTTGSATERGPRMVWQVGAQPASQQPQPSAQMPRPRPAERVMAAGVETPADVPWPVGAREDRVPSEVALAYAASAAAPPQAPSVTRSAAPMGSLRPNQERAQRAAARARTAVATPPRASSSRLVGNPWLRGIILAPSMQGAMGVTTMGPPNYLALTPMLHKPSTAVANTFAGDPQFGLSTRSFKGSAVAFIRTIDFRRITVGLN